MATSPARYASINCLVPDRAEVCRRADDPDGAHRQQRQRHRIVTGVVRELALRDNSRRGRQVTLGILDRDNPLMFGQPQHGVGGNGDAGTTRNVVQHHRHVGGVRDPPEVLQLSRPAVAWSNTA